MREPPKRGRKSIIRLRADRIELVLMAPCALGRQTQESLRHRPNLFLQLVLDRDALHPIARAYHRVVNPRDQKTRCCNASGAGLHLVPRNLHLNKTIIRHVLIEGLDDPIPIRPTVQPREVPLEAIALPEANHVEPMPSPTLTISRGLQKLIDQQPISLIAWIAFKGLNLFEARRQSDQVIEDPSQKGPGRCPRIGLQSIRAKFRQNIRVDHIPHRPTFLDIGLNLPDSDRQWTRSEFAKRPPIVSSTIVRADPEPVDRLGGQAGPLRDPLAQELFLLVGQLDLRGHLLGRNYLP